MVRRRIKTRRGANGLISAPEPAREFRVSTVMVSAEYPMDNAYTRTYDRLKPLHVVLIAIVVMTVAGGSLLLSASNAPVPVDGAIEWHEGSILRAVVELLCLNYALPTNYAGDIKILILGIGTCLALLAIGVATITRSPAAAPVRSEEAADDSSAAISTNEKSHIPPLFAAQTLAGLYLLWSFASSRWSTAPDLALGACVLLGIALLWSFAIGRGLTPAAARIAAHLVFAIGVLTALIAIWYFYGRNPNLRAKFPFGNPTFLAAAMIPSILIGLSIAAGAIALVIRSNLYRSTIGGLVFLLGAVICLYAVHLSQARGAIVGVVFGLLAATFFAVRSRWRWLPVGIAVVGLAVGAILFLRSSSTPSNESRAATAQLRGFAWEYAWRMFTEHPLRGHGQAGFALVGDSYATDDVLQHPGVLEARIAHVHNEWLEVLADLGSIGLCLIGGTFFLTLVAGDAVLMHTPPGMRKWTLIGLMASLVGLIVEESIGVGLRTGGLPVIFYSVLGLIWAFSRHTVDNPNAAGRSMGLRWITAVLGITLALSSIVLTRQDFRAARNEFQADESFSTDNFDETIRLSELATHRLSPQRVLLAIFRLSESHLHAAEYLQARAQDRQARAAAESPPSEKLLTLASEDYQASEVHCEAGSGWLKKLVERSPGFINQGRLAYRFSVARAINAGVRGDTERQLALMQNAALAVEREIKRQPYDTSLAADWVNTNLSLPDTKVSLADVWTMLARPLRRHRIDSTYIELLDRFATSDAFLKELNGVIHDTYVSLRDDKDERAAYWTKSWAPEKIRLAAALQFRRRDYATALNLLQSVKPAYDQLRERATYAAAAFYAEQAECSFFANPLKADTANENAREALKLAPQSLPGRKLRAAIRSRQVDYVLADGDEEKAIKLLKTVMGPAGKSTQDTNRELGLRYARLGESVLNAEQKSAADLQLSDTVKEHIRLWTKRVIELNPEEAQAQFASANLLWRIGDEQSAADQLRTAIAKGLSVETATSFLSYALGTRPDSPELKSIYESIKPPEPHQESNN